MPSTRKAAAKKSSPKKKTKAKPAAKRRSSKTKASAGPLVEVARKIGAKLGEVAVRTGIVKPGGNEPSGQ